jgi:hypothetical protein
MLMDMAGFFRWAGHAFSGHALLVVLLVLAVMVSLFIMYDAHKHKKKRARHRWK